MIKLTKYLNIATIAMFVITGVLMVMYYAGGEVPNQLHPTPVFTNEMIVWAYILLAIAAGSAFLFGILGFIMNIKEAKKSLISLAAIAVCVFISYAMADGTLIDLPGYTGGDNTPSTLIFADTILYSMYFLGVGAIVAIISTEILSKLR